MPGATKAIEMRASFGQEAEGISSPLQKFFNKMFHLEIYDLEKDIKDLSPTTIALFKAIEGQIETAQMILVEKLTADTNMDQFTAGTEKGIAKDMPAEMIPLVIAALAKIATISHNAHVEYENMKGQLPAMLIQLKESLIRQAVLAHDNKIKDLEKKKTALESSQPAVVKATIDLAHDPAQQRKVENQTGWFKTTIASIKTEITTRRRELQIFVKENNFLEAGAEQLAAPLL